MVRLSCSKTIYGHIHIQAVAAIWSLKLVDVILKPLYIYTDISRCTDIYEFFIHTYIRNQKRIREASTFTSRRSKT